MSAEELIAATLAVEQARAVLWTKIRALEQLLAAHRSGHFPGLDPNAGDRRHRIAEIRRRGALAVEHQRDV